jgi:hypothetical protein
MSLGDLFARTVAGALGKGVAAVAREVAKQGTKEIEKFAITAEAIADLPSCCAGSLMHTSDGSRVVYVHASGCAKVKP